MKRMGVGVGAVIGAVAVMVLAGPAGAVPSFARQTGWSCAVCHTVFPELTPLGRKFKLNGYVTDAMANPKPGAIEVTEAPPLAAMIIADDAIIKTQPASAGTDEGTDHRGTARFPDQLSLFYAGPITGKLGAFVQLTFAPDAGSIGMDMMDVRYATHFDVFDYDLVLGVDANNNPTSQDTWNTGPAWGFPFVVSSVTPTPAIGPNFANLAGTVASLGAYVWFDDMLYAEFSGYRSAPEAPVAPGDFQAIQRFAPYWRIALQHEEGRFVAEIGTYGMQTATRPNGLDGSVLPDGSFLPISGPTDPEDHTRDVAFDGQLQYLGDAHIVSVRANLIKESSLPDATFGLGGTNNEANSLRFGSLAAEYVWNRKIGVTIAYAMVSGSLDPVLYSSDAGFFANNPDSAGVTYELDYLPWKNAKFAAQYVAYSKFNGDKFNYDGSNRSAADNDTLALIAQLMF